MQANKGPIGYKRPVIGQLGEIDLASRDAVAGILTRLWGGPDGVQVKRYGHRISGNSLETLFRSSDNTYWVLHQQLNPTKER